MARTATIVWFRHDLRLRDNPAFAAACTRGGAVIPLFIRHDGAFPTGLARRRLAASLRALERGLATQGLRLILRRGDPPTEMASVARACGAEAVAYNRSAEPAWRAVQRNVDSIPGCATFAFDGDTLQPSGLPSTGSGAPYRVFTPFGKALSSLRLPEAPRGLPHPQRTSMDIASATFSDLGLDGAHADAGEEAAHARLASFLAGPVSRYAQERNMLAVDGTSRLSAHLALGEISVRAIWDALGPEGEPFRRQLAWREFARQLLAGFPHTVDDPLRPEFASFPWEPDEAMVRAWKEGRTGYPLVDAGMRQMLETGWMHNRARMVVASFLVKHLLQDWRVGAAWFMERLSDADLANNTLGWQWVAGCGADAAPYDRVFNPVLQGERFDPGGAYVRRWVPELAAVPDAYIHAPWRGGKVIGYPAPVVDHAEARARALRAYSHMRAAADRSGHHD